MPIELGHGAMGTTYKAFDIDLQYPVTLKVISEDTFATNRLDSDFFAKRGPQPGCVTRTLPPYFIWQTAERYLSAMELWMVKLSEKLITRSGRLEVKLALQIATQVVAGLAALHKEKLVHRDVKPSNIMVMLRKQTL